MDDAAVRERRTCDECSEVCPVPDCVVAGGTSGLSGPVSFAGD